MRKKAFGYARVTRAEQEAGSTWRDQADLIIPYARSVGFENVTIFHDEPVAQAHNIGCSLGGIYGMLEVIFRHNVKFVIVTSVDRLDIPETETPVLAELVRRRKHVIEVSEDFSLDEYNNRKGSGSSKMQSGPIPFGYMKSTKGELIAHPQESLIVQRIFQTYADCQSFEGVRRQLQKDDVRTRRGHKWSRAGLSWLLGNDTYAGKDDQPSIICLELYEETRRIMNKKRRRKANTENEGDDD